MSPHAAYRFRRLTRDDFSLLKGWLEQPHVERWWNHQTSPEAMEEDFGKAIDGKEPSEDLIVHRDGAPIGLVQRSGLDGYPEYLADFEAVAAVPRGAMTIDYFVGDPESTGRGIGTEMIRAAVDDIWRSRPEVPAILVAVTAANVASWRILEKAGFTRIGEAEMEPDNPIDDTTHYVYRIDRP